MLNWFLVELLVFEEMKVVSSEGSSHLWHQTSLGFYLAIFSLSAVASFSSVKQGKEGKNPANCDL